MILDFPAIRERELFYIYILRYHKYVGRLFLKDSFEDFYEHRKNIENVLFPKKVENCLSDLSMSSETYINKHSVLPYYRLFLPRERYEQAVELMLHTDCSYVAKLYKDSKTKRERDCIYYCPICHQLASGTYEDIQIYHQVPEVFVCEKHKCYLNRVPIRPLQEILKPECWNVTVKECENEILLGIASDISYILRSNLRMDGVSLRKRLRQKVIEMHIYDKYRGWTKRLKRRYLKNIVNCRRNTSI